MTFLHFPGFGLYPEIPRFPKQHNMRESKEHAPRPRGALAKKDLQALENIPGAVLKRKKSGIRGKTIKASLILSGRPRLISIPSHLS